MMTPEQFADVIEMVETNDRPEAWGDHDHAVGAYQVHLDWLFDHALRWNLRPLENEAANAFIRRVVVAFGEHYLKIWPAIEVGMAFHEGHHVQLGADDWDARYSTRWAAAVEQCLGKLN